MYSKTNLSYFFIIIIRKITNCCFISPFIQHDQTNYERGESYAASNSFQRNIQNASESRRLAPTTRKSGGEPSADIPRTSTTPSSSQVTKRRSDSDTKEHGGDQRRVSPLSRVHRQTIRNPPALRPDHSNRTPFSDDSRPAPGPSRARSFSGEYARRRASSRRGHTRTHTLQHGILRHHPCRKERDRAENPSPRHNKTDHDSGERRVSKSSRRAITVDVVEAGINLRRGKAAREERGAGCRRATNSGGGWLTGQRRRSGAPGTTMLPQRANGRSLSVRRWRRHARTKAHCPADGLLAPEATRWASSPSLRSHTPRNANETHGRHTQYWHCAHKQEQMRLVARGLK